jgi:hypothetical protein
MNFFMQQFGISFKHYSLENVLRFADYLIDMSVQKYGKPLVYLIEKLYMHSIYDEAKHFWKANEELVGRHLSEHIKSELLSHEIEYPIEDIKDVFGPITASSSAVGYLQVPEKLKVHFIDTDDKLSLIDLLQETEVANEPIGIDSEWRPSMNIFHQT